MQKRRKSGKKATTYKVKHTIPAARGPLQQHIKKKRRQKKCRDLILKKRNIDKSFVRICHNKHPENPGIPSKMLFSDPENKQQSKQKKSPGRRFHQDKILLFKRKCFVKERKIYLISRCMAKVLEIKKIIFLQNRDHPPQIRGTVYGKTLFTPGTIARMNQMQQRKKKTDSTCSRSKNVTRRINPGKILPLHLLIYHGHHKTHTLAGEPIAQL